MIKKLIGTIIAGALLTAGVTGFAAFEEHSRISFGSESDIEAMEFTENPSKVTVDEVEVDVEKYSHSIEDGALKLTTDILVDKSLLSENYLKKGYNGMQATYAFDSVAGKVNFSYKFKVDRGVERVQFLAAMAPVQLRLFGNSIQAKTGNTQLTNNDFVTVKSNCVSVDKFHSIDILVDFDNTNVSVFFDGEKIIDRHAFYKSANVAGGIALGGVSKISFKEDEQTGEVTNTTGSIWYDDIVISTIDNHRDLTKLTIDDESGVTYDIKPATDTYSTTAAVENNGVSLTTVTSALKPAASSASIELPVISGNSVVEFTLDVNDAVARAQDVIWLCDNSGDVVVRWRLFGPSFQLRNSSGGYDVTIGEYDSNKIAKVRIELNVKDQTYNAYINGVLADGAENIPFYSADAENAAKIVLFSGSQVAKTVSETNPLTAKISIRDISVYAEGDNILTDNFKDMKGEVRDGELSFEYKSYNFDETAVEKVIIGAIYDENNNLVDCGIIDGNTEASAASYGKLSYAYNEGMNNYKFRFYVWDNFDNISSLMEVDETTVGALLK